MRRSTLPPLLRKALLALLCTYVDPFFQLAEFGGLSAVVDWQPMSVWAHMNADPAAMPDIAGAPRVCAGKVMALVFAAHTLPTHPNTAPFRRRIGSALCGQHPRQRRPCSVDIGVGKACAAE